MCPLPHTVQDCHTLLPLPDYLNSHHFAKDGKMKLCPFLNHSFLHWVPAPSNKAPFKKFERKTLSEIWDCTHFSFYFSQGHYKSWHNLPCWTAASWGRSSMSVVLRLHAYLLLPKKPLHCHGAKHCRSTSCCWQAHKSNQQYSWPVGAFWGAMRQRQDRVQEDMAVPRRPGVWLGQIRTTWHIGCCITQQM